MNTAMDLKNVDYENEYKSALHEAAIKYAEQGIPVFPLKPKTKDKPVVKWGTEATTDTNVINRWWSENPDYNVAIVTGQKSGIVVVDFDTEDAWEYGQAQGLPVSPTVKTSRGYHVYCSYQEGIRNFQKRSDLPGIDLRGEGGYVVAPPSVHETGSKYGWVEGKHYVDHPLCPLPEWIHAKKPEEIKPVENLLAGVGKGERNNALARIQGSVIGNGYTYDEAMLNASIWNQSNSEPLDEKEVKNTVDSIFKREHGSIPDLVDVWENPILLEGINTPELGSDLLPSWLGEYAHAVSQFTQTSESLAVMIALSTVATCVQKRFEVSPYGDEYREILALWTLTMLPPSERKTPVMQEMMRPVDEWESAQRERMVKQIYEVQTKRAVAQKRIEKLKQNAANAQDEEERNKLIEEAIDIESKMPEEVVAPKLWTSDSTTEKLQELLIEQGERMSIISDEGGIFEVMAGLYNEGKINIDVYLNGYSGSQVRVDRKNRQSVDLKRPAISFGLAVQPMVMEEFASKRKKAFRGKGALARFLYCVPESKVGKRDISRRFPIPTEVKARYIEGINRLLAIDKVVDQNKREVPRILILEPDALRIWEEFSMEVEGMLAPDKDLSAFTDWGGKLAGNCLRIAGLMHLVDKGPGVSIIDKNTVTSAVKLCRLLIDHALAAFGVIKTDEVLNGARKMFNWIEKNDFKGFSRNECHRALHATFELSEQLEKPLRTLEDRHIIKQQKIKTSGRDKIWYEVNPYFRNESTV